MADFFEQVEEKVVEGVDFVTSLPEKGHKLSNKLNEFQIQLAGNIEDIKTRSQKTARENLKQGKFDSLALQFVDYIQTTEGMIVSGVVLIILYKILK